MRQELSDPTGGGGFKTGRQYEYFQGYRSLNVMRQADKPVGGVDITGYIYTSQNPKKNQAIWSKSSSICTHTHVEHTHKFFLRNWPPWMAYKYEHQFRIGFIRAGRIRHIE